MQYCHYVAGLVGIGLSRLFSASGLESEEVGQDHKLANSMGLFLQKTNIIRDYLEDVQDRRHFWPKEVFIYTQCTIPVRLNIGRVLTLLRKQSVTVLFIDVCAMWLTYTANNICIAC